jgi:hypothetical protein
VADIDFPDDLINAERQAWAEIQRGALTTETAAAVQAGVTAFAEELGQNRVDVEMALKKRVRHPELAA